MIANEAVTCSADSTGFNNSAIDAFISTVSAGMSAATAMRWVKEDIGDGISENRGSDVITPRQEDIMIRKLPSGGYRLYSRKKNPSTGKRRNLGTFKTRAAAEKHEKQVQYFKRH